VSPKTYEVGMILSADMFMSESILSSKRGINWIDEAANQIHLFYAPNSTEICFQVYVSNEFVYENCVLIELDESDGSDGLWHNLSIELLGTELLGWRDDKVLFEVNDDRLLQVHNLGYITLMTRGCLACFDDIVMTSIGYDPYICGDANSDATVNVSDAVWIINYVFTGGAAPDPIVAGDANCDGISNVSDAVWIINYVFIGGNIPCDSDGDDIPDC
jgi:Dockerin type I domain